MSEITYDIGEMLDSLGMTTAAIRWKQILDDPERTYEEYDQRKDRRQRPEPAQILFYKSHRKDPIVHTRRLPSR